MLSQDLSELVDRLHLYQSSVRRPSRRPSESGLPRHRTEREDVIDRILRKSLLLSQKDRFVDPDHPYFDRCRAKFEEMRQVIGFTDQSLENMFRLLQGNLRYPPLILHNPRLTQDRQYREMIAETDTLSWLESVLGEIGLALNDIVILDRFPLLASETLLQLTACQRSRIVEQSFDMTQDYLETFSPEIVVSCYCHSPEIFLSDVHKVTQDRFRSSLSGADKGDVNVVSIEKSGKDISIVQAFHPSYGLRTLDEGRQRRLKTLLKEVYEPCAKWKQMCAFENLSRCLAAFHKSCASLMVSLEHATDASISMQESLRADLKSSE